MRHLTRRLLTATCLMWAAVSMAKAQSAPADIPVVNEPVFEEEEVDDPVVLDPIAPNVKFSETFWQPNAQAHAVDARVSYDRWVNDVKNAAGSNVGTENVKDTMGSLTYLYGLSERSAASVGLDFVSSSRDVSLTGASAYTLNSSGLSIVRFDVLHTIPLGLLSLHFGLGADLSPGKRKEPTAASEGNAYPGGHTIRGDLGFDIRVNRGWFGVLAGFESRLRRDLETTNGAEVNITGGNQVVLLAFYEHHWGKFFLLPSIRITPTAPESTSSPTGVSDSGAYVPTIYSLGAGYYVMNESRLTLTYERLFNPGHTTGANSAADSYSANRVLAGVRVVF